MTYIQRAVSDVSEQSVPFFVSSEHWGTHSLKPFHRTHQPTLTVETVGLDESLDQMGVQEVTVLKIDIEGADFLALRSFDFVKLRPKVVVCEFMDERSRKSYGYSHHDVVSYMLDFGYTAFVSEWAPIVEYGRKGRYTPHTFLGCSLYPLDHEPAWGNLIFVPADQARGFEETLRGYLRRSRFVSILGSIPGSRPLYRAVRSLGSSMFRDTRS